MYKKMGIKYSFAAHLRDTGTVSFSFQSLNFRQKPFRSIYFQYGFSLPEQWIRPVGEETSRMVEYLADFIAVIGKECH
jgi:extracellular matrix protein 14